ncbi:MAG TPA: molecular chaperone HtpG [Alphaproteobacteria bacterium]|nr:molecular chaperone HtpG [Alphaproteobacteria bacterium]
MSEEKLSFQAEVARLLKLMVNSVYSEREVFLRELVSNASDACDKLRYRAIAEPELTADDPEFRVEITIDRTARSLTVADNGIGMGRDDLIQDLGTIARSGTAAFVETLEGESRDAVQQIGQFGVGFYAVFMVADRVDVVSRKAGEAHAWRWSSDGLGEFTIAEAERAGRGTSITLHLKTGEDEWLEPERLRRVIRTYSDHIPLPIRLREGPDGEAETVNAASAIWTRPKAEVSEEQYREFYHHVGHAMDDPWLTIHYKAEGKIEYAALLYVPAQRPYDLFDPARRHRVKLYVRRVFITDEAEGLLPAYLRFLRGVVDSEDLPLNISREMLQNTPVMVRMRQAITKRVLGELKKKAEKAPEDYARFWDCFGAVLKEGLYEDSERREELLELARFHSTVGDGLVSLKDYVSRMKDGQSAIYYISGDDLDLLRSSPQLEGYRARGVEVLLLSDPIDDFWVPTVEDYDGKPLRSATRGASDLSAIPTLDKDARKGEEAEPAREADVATLVALLKQTLGDAVKDVRSTDRLTDSPVCLVADEGDLDLRLERMLKAHHQLDRMSARILELNPVHPLVRSLAARAAAGGAANELADMAWLLLDQARIIEGEPLPDPAAFSRRMAQVMTRAVAPQD